MLFILFYLIKMSIYVYDNKNITFINCSFNFFFIIIIWVIYSYVIVHYEVLFVIFLFFITIHFLELLKFQCYLIMYDVALVIVHIVIEVIRVYVAFIKVVYHLNSFGKIRVDFRVKLEVHYILIMKMLQSAVD